MDRRTHGVIMNLIYSANKERGALDMVIDDPATYAVTVVPTNCPSA